MLGGLKELAGGIGEATRGTNMEVGRISERSGIRPAWEADRDGH